LPPEQVARHQQARLEAAMVEAVGRYGYAGTTLRELVRLAGVSKSTFYDHFESKQEAFLVTSDTIVEQLRERVRPAFDGEGDHRDRLVAALTTFMQLVIDEPAAATLTAVETLTLGRAGIECRDRGSAVIEDTVRLSFEQAPTEREVSETTVHAIAAGIRGIVYRHVRAGTATALPGLASELADWALGYQAPPSEAVRRASAAAQKPQPAADAGEEIPWDEPPDSQRSRAELTQRERIVRAIGQLVVESGYETLSVPAISAKAGTSNQTFYEHFDNKRDAFLAAFDVSAAGALTSTTAAFEAESDNAEAIGSGLRAMLDYVYGNELFARLAFFDLQTAGPVALDRADVAMESFTAFLKPGRDSKEVPKPISATILQAIASGGWAAIQHELVTGERGSAAGLAPELVTIVVSPLFSE
jgi:AcrR family transcriptional regulator